ncbi:MAG: zinc ribbon domain-containing protein [Chloroflexi bacterium]|nr:zinc ribbon domain-containing protein [Chloroflexota bacterium]MDA1002239.1 zinc ribbon domain-containing protein [Chloroflexota bacterium]
MPGTKKPSGTDETAASARKRNAPSAKGGGGPREYMKDFAHGRDTLFCQSCGFNMRRDPDFGTEADGTLTEQWCSGCYHDGAFAEEVDSADAFIHAAVQRIAAQRKQAIGKTRLDLKKELPKLARWA